MAAAAVVVAAVAAAAAVAVTASIKPSVEAGAAELASAAAMKMIAYCSHKK